MDITYIPAIAEIIEKCRSAPFNVCNNPVNLSKAVKEDRIWQVYWHWSSFVPTTNRFKDAPRAVQPPTPLVHHPSAMQSPPAERSHSAVDSPPASLPVCSHSAFDLLALQHF
jgi:hypothetical protein